MLRNRNTTIGIILAFLTITLLSCAAAVPAPPSDPPVRVHLTWQHSDTSTTITVTWQTVNATSGNTVEYDTISRSGNPALYAYSLNGSTPPHTYIDASGWIHDVELTGLIQNTTYYFICGGNTGGWSTERKFRTAPTNPTSLTFIAGGDCRSNSTERDIISNAMKAYNPSFVLFTGDMVDQSVSPVQPQWDDFFTSLDQLWIDNNGFTIPIIPSIGNHETADGGDHYFIDQFALPSPERWYSLDWGSLAHIIVLDTETTMSGTQQAWLQNDLATHASIPWKIAVFHQPPFSSGTHGSNTNVRTYWVPLFDQYHVQIVFSGHDHDYERSLPINYTESQTSPQPFYQNGTMYIVTGGWGAPLYPVGTNWWTAYSQSTHHFVLADIYANGTLNLQAKNASGNTFDIVQETLIPEFPQAILLPLLIIATLIAAAYTKRATDANPNTK